MSKEQSRQYPEIEFLTQEALEQSYPYTLPVLAEYGSALVHNDTLIPGPEEKIAHQGIEVIRAIAAEVERGKLGRMGTHMLLACKGSPLPVPEIAEYCRYVWGVDYPWVSIFTVMNKLSDGVEEGNLQTKPLIEFIRGIHHFKTHQGGGASLSEIGGFMTTLDGLRRLTIRRGPPPARDNGLLRWLPREGS